MFSASHKGEAMTERALVPALSRRRLLTVLGVGAAAATAPLPLLKTATAATNATCSASDTDEQEVGPFYVADGLVRSAITSGEDGIPLTFTVTLTDSDTCEPLVGAAVDVWQANATGVYSDEASESTVGDTYLRGIQISDSAGKVTFTSIYPGWYAGRTNHIHTRVYTGGTVSGTSFDYSNATLIHTGQIFFDATINTTVAAVSPYSTNSVARTTNAEDRVYTQQHGTEVLTTTTGNTTDGYAATVALTISGSGASTGTDASKLTLAASHHSVVDGQKVTLSGKLRDSSDSTGISGATLTITAKAPSGKKVTAHVKTATGGAWSVTFTPTATATYHASYAATSGHAAATSSAVDVVVHHKVVVTDVSATAPAGTAVFAAGAISPAKRGTEVVVHKVVDGKRTTLTSTTTNAEGEWTARWHLSKGKHHVVVTTPATTNLAAGTSRTLTIHRT
jgi:protocatechuate 3,4-dioxygenase beta subunit